MCFSPRTLTRSSAPPWSLTHCSVAPSLLCPAKSRGGWAARSAAWLLSTSPLSCCPLTRLWGTCAPSDPWWRGMWWPGTEASSWRSKQLRGEVSTAAAIKSNNNHIEFLFLYLWALCVCVLTELEKQMKIENLFVTWQQRSAQSNMPISVSTSVSSCDRHTLPHPQNNYKRKCNQIWPLIFDSSICMNTLNLIYLF